MSATSTLRLRIFDGTRQPFAAPAQFLITITDGTQTQQVRQYYTANDITFTGLPFFDNFGDDYSVVAWASGYRQAGFVPVKLSNKSTFELDLMLIADDPGFNFANATFPAASTAYPLLTVIGQSGYDDILDQQEPVLACILNICEAMSQIKLPNGQTPLSYIKQLRSDGTYAPAQDRFFAWCDPALIQQIITAGPKQFAVELNPGLLHPGATRSWKQIQFGEANVQFTFHENDKLTLNGTACVMIELDIDYYQDLAAHIILEVIPNALTHSLTDPTQVYVLRWIAGRTADIPEFAPLYTITG
jgi:hypothetical protein